METPLSPRLGLKTESLGFTEEKREKLFLALEEEKRIHVAEKAEFAVVKRAMQEKEEVLYKEVASLETQLKMLRMEHESKVKFFTERIAFMEQEAGDERAKFTKDLEKAGQKRDAANHEAMKRIEELEHLQLEFRLASAERDEFKSQAERLRHQQRELVMRPSLDAEKLRSAEGKLFEIDSEMSMMKADMAEAERAAAEKDEEIARLTALLGDAATQRVALEEELQHRKKDHMRMQSDLQSVQAELEVAKAAATSGVKAGAAAISAAAANFEALQAQLTRSMAFGRLAEPPTAAYDDELRTLRADVQHLQLEVEHGDTQLSVKSSESERLKLELQQMRSMVAQQATRFEEEKQLLKHGVISQDHATEPRTIAEALHGNTLIGGLVVKEAAERTGRGAAERKMSRLQAALARSRVTAETQKSELMRLQKKLSATEASGLRKTEATDAMTRRVEALQGALRMQLHQSAERFVSKKHQQTLLPSINEQSAQDRVSTAPGGTRASTNRAQSSPSLHGRASTAMGGSRAASKEALQGPRTLNSSEMLTQLYDPAPPSTLYSKESTDMGLSLRRQAAKNRA